MLATFAFLTVAMTIPDSAMGPTYEALAESLMGKLRSPKPHWVCIAGGPGSGKSTLAQAVADIVNKAAGAECAIVLPMDGFHYSRSQLYQLDPPDAPSFLPRRGAPWTFDAEACYECFKEAKLQGEAVLPTYSREKSDPVPGGVRLKTSHKIVLVEGNYLLGATGETERWEPLLSLWDERWFIKCPDAAAQRQRLIERHLETWNDEKARRWGAGAEGAAARADANDVLNMELIAPMEAVADRN